MSKPPKQYDALAVYREYVKRFGDTGALNEKTGVSEGRSFRWQEDLFDKQMDFINDPLASKQRSVLAERVRHMRAVTTLLKPPRAMLIHYRPISV